jgi:hypothetical protein
LCLYKPAKSCWILMPSLRAVFPFINLVVYTSRSHSDHVSLLW